MAATTHQTSALILKSTPLRESDRFVELFTREFGLIRAIGKSAREERSKLRYALEPYSVADVTLVRGRDVWRIRGASSELNLYRSLESDEAKRELVAKVAALLSRLLAGEEQNVTLYTSMIDGFLALREIELEADELRSYEALMVLRVLNELGYKLPRSDWQRYMDASLSKELAHEFMRERAEAVRLINETLRETQL